MADPSFAEVVEDYANRLGTTASSAADVVKDSAAKAEAGTYDAKEFSAAAAKLLALWVGAWIDLLPFGRGVILTDSGETPEPVRETIVLQPPLASKPTLALEGPLRNGFGVQLPLSAVKLTQDDAKATKEFTVEVTPPADKTGMFRGIVLATLPAGSPHRIQVAIQVP